MQLNTCKCARTHIYTQKQVNKQINSLIPAQAYNTHAHMPQCTRARAHKDTYTQETDTERERERGTHTQTPRQMQLHTRTRNAQSMMKGLQAKRLTDSFTRNIADVCWRSRPGRTLTPQLMCPQIPVFQRSQDQWPCP